MRNFKLALARFLAILALAFGFYLYRLHSQKKIMVYPPCLPGYFIGHEEKDDIAHCIKGTK